MKLQKPTCIRYLPNTCPISSLQKLLFLDFAITLPCVDDKNINHSVMSTLQWGSQLCLWVISTIFTDYTSATLLNSRNYCSRALLGLSMGYNYCSLTVPELSSHKTVKCQRSNKLKAVERNFEPLQILDCKYEEVRAFVMDVVGKW